MGRLPGARGPGDPLHYWPELYAVGVDYYSLQTVKESSQVPEPREADGATDIQRPTNDTQIIPPELVCDQITRQV